MLDQNKGTKLYYCAVDFWIKVVKQKVLNTFYAACGQLEGRQFYPIFYHPVYTFLISCERGDVPKLLVLIFQNIYILRIFSVCIWRVHINLKVQLIVSYLNILFHRVHK